MKAIKRRTIPLNALMVVKMFERVWTMRKKKSEKEKEYSQKVLENNSSRNC